MGTSTLESLRKALEEPFEEDSFTTGNIPLTELGLEVTLEPNQFYKKEEVPDVPRRKRRIRAIYDNPFIPESEHPTYGWSGAVSAEFSGREAWAYVVLVQENLDPANRISVLGHEHGHFLWHIGKEGLIYSRFKRPGLVKSRMEDTEDFGLLCGWIALKKAGYDLTDVHAISGIPALVSKAEAAKKLVLDNWEGD